MERLLNAVASSALALFELSQPLDKVAVICLGENQLANVALYQSHIAVNGTQVPYNGEYAIVGGNEQTGKSSLMETGHYEEDKEFMVIGELPSTSDDERIIVKLPRELGYWFRPRVVAEHYNIYYPGSTHESPEKEYPFACYTNPSVRPLYVF